MAAEIPEKALNKFAWHFVKPGGHMTAEWVTAIATSVTALVIASSAAAALFQLRHMRGSNQIVALTELRETLESESFQTRLHDVIGPFQERLNDAEFRTFIMSHRYVYGIKELQSALTIAAFFENVGVLVKHHIVDEELFCDLWAGVVTSAWGALEQFVVNRRLISGPGLYENFEYLVRITEEFLAKHPHGTLSARFERRMPAYVWPESAQYVKS
jgi:hypothetical protein